MTGAARQKLGLRSRVGAPDSCVCVCVCIYIHTYMWGSRFVGTFHFVCWCVGTLGRWLITPDALVD